MLLGGVILLWGGGIWLKEEGRRAGGYPLLVPFLLLFAATALSVLVADPFPWVTPMGKWRYYFTYFPLVFLFVKFPNLPSRLVPFAVGTAMGLGLLACLQYFGVGWTGRFVGHGLAEVPGDPLHFIARGLFPHHTLFATVVTLLFLFLLAGFLATPSKKGRTLFGVGLVFSGLALVLTFSRGSWLAAIAGTVIVLLVARGRKAFAGLAVATVVVGLTIAAVPSLRERAGRLRLSQNQDRVALWESALRMFRERPLTGKGFHSYGHYQSQYLTDQEKRDFHYVPAEVHSIYLDLLAGTGLLGFLCFLGLVGVAGRNLHRAHRRMKPGDELSVYAAVATGTAVLVNNLTDSHLYSTYGGMTAVFFLAMGQAIYFRRTSKR